MLTRNVHSLGLVNNHTKAVNSLSQNVLINYSITLRTAINNLPKNEDYDDTLPINGAMYVVNARKKDGSYTTFRRDSNEEVNLLTQVLNNPNHSFYQ
jgi:hypothetical protein